MSDNRFDRQELLFGRAGQTEIEKTIFAIVGLGGTGSHVVQQLAYLGAARYALIDGDLADTTSMNRLVTAMPSDVGSAKVDLAERYIRRFQPNADVVRVKDTFISEAGFDAILSSGVVVGCLDKETPRIVLNELCQAYELPYVDLAAGVSESHRTEFGGRVVFSLNGDCCLMCADEIDQAILREEQSTQAAKEADVRIYGVRASALGNSGPSVVMINGVIASLAVTEIVAYVTGLRAPARLLRYRGKTGTVTRGLMEPTTLCAKCKAGGLRGLRDGADVRRHIRNGLGNHF